MMDIAAYESDHVFPLAYCQEKGATGPTTGSHIASKAEEPSFRRFFVFKESEGETYQGVIFAVRCPGNICSFVYIPSTTMSRIAPCKCCRRLCNLSINRLWP